MPNHAEEAKPYTLSQWYVGVGENSSVISTDVGDVCLCVCRYRWTLLSHKQILLTYIALPGATAVTLAHTYVLYILFTYIHTPALPTPCAKQLIKAIETELERRPLKTNHFVVRDYRNAGQTFTLYHQGFQDLTDTSYIYVYNHVNRLRKYTVNFSLCFIEVFTCR